MAVLGGLASGGSSVKDGRKFLELSLVATYNSLITEMPQMCAKVEATQVPQNLKNLGLILAATFR